MLSIQTQLILAAIDQLPETEYAAFMKEFEKRRKPVVKKPKKPKTQNEWVPDILVEIFKDRLRQKHSVARKLA